MPGNHYNGDTAIKSRECDFDKNRIGKRSVASMRIRKELSVESFTHKTIQER